MDVPIRKRGAINGTFPIRDEVVRGGLIPYPQQG